MEVGDIVTCTVERIQGTLVFVKIDGNGEGSIILSEIAAGRIRNLRDYVVPKKRIVCKVLRIIGDRIDLSLRRVTKKEAKEAQEAEKLEKSSASILKSVLKEKAQQIIEEIKKESSLYEFLQEAKQKSSELEKLVGKQDAAKILEIINAQKQKKAEIKKEIHLTTAKSNGLALIKNILGNITDAKVSYISAGKYAVKAEANDLKSAGSKIKNITDKIESFAKQNQIHFDATQSK